MKLVLNVPIVPASGACLSGQTLAEFDLYTTLDRMLTKKLGKSGGPRFVMQLYDRMLLELVAHTMRLGTFRLPSDLGHFRLVRLRGAPPRVALRFAEGPSVRLALGRKDRGKKFNRRKHLPEIVRMVTDLALEQTVGFTEVTAQDIQSLFNPQE